MNEQTRPVRVYFHAEGPPRPAFGEDIDKADAENYSYCGWLPLALTPPSEPDGEHVTAILGDNWLTIPREAIQRPNAGAAGYPISAADCHTEIEARAKCNLAYFLKETPDETGEPYDRRQIATEIRETLRTLLDNLRNDENTLSELGSKGATTVLINVQCIRVPTEDKRTTTLSDRHETQLVEEFVRAYRAELLEYIKRRIAETRQRVRKMIHAAHRFDAFAG